MTWHEFGERERFAVEFAFLPDPDRDTGRVRYDSASWGAVRLWVRGENLCKHAVEEHVDTAVHWYLYPTFDWLAVNWDALLHESRLPSTGGDRHSAREAYYAVLHRTRNQLERLGSDARSGWDGWWRRHALRASRTGGLYPDMFIRRVLDFVEISWGRSPLPGMPKAFAFTNAEGVANLPVGEVAEPLEAALWKAYAILAESWPSEETRGLARHLEAIRAGSTEDRRRWYIAGENAPVADAFAALPRRLSPQEIRSPAFKGEVKPTHIDRLAPMVMMFGTVSPEISGNDAELLARTVIQSYTGAAGESEALRHHIDERPLSGILHPYEEGYELALDLLEELGLPDEDDESVDIDALIDRLGITVLESKFEDRMMRGVAIAGDQQQPTILVNGSHVAHQYRSGRRFTLAHELCHICHDRGYGRSLALVSGPWAPHGVEQRANAFAAMVLMPEPILDKALARAQEPFGTVGWAVEIARMMGVGVKSAVDHLGALGIVGRSVCDEIIRELNAPNSETDPTDTLPPPGPRGP